MRHPHLSALHSLYLSETQPFRKVHRMIDLFESLIKMHTVVILAEYVRHNRLSDAAKGLLSQGLRTPSLGTWQLFSRVLFEELDKEGFSWMTISFPVGFRALEKALNEEKTNVIAFRNGYAHGATPNDSTCEDDMRKYEPFLAKLMEAQWLQDTACEVREDRVFLATSGGGLSLHPFLLHRPETDGPSLAFFNDLKNDRVGLLNYPLGKHYRERAFYAEFLEHLPLHEWRRSGNNEFHQRIEELTETFKGRSRERALLLSFVRQHRKGYLSVQGNPGIGKSALLAQFFKDLRADASLGQVQVVEYFIRRGTQQAQAEYMLGYLLRRTDEFFPKGREVRAEGQAAFDLQSQLFGKWRLWGEQGAGQKLLILIDGLDEGVENRVVDYLPRENFDNILFVYGSRPGGHRSIDELWTNLPPEHHTRVDLAGLSREDIRALVYEVANKYEVERESPWIEAVQQRSQGNPLYLKLLCDAIENGSIALNDIQALPDRIDEYYKAILDRYVADTLDGDALLAGLFTFAAARDYLTMAHLGLINKLGDATVQRIGSTLKEVLYENPLTEEVLDYQLFHESFREYLVKEKASKVKDATERIIDFCSAWRAFEGTWEQRYTLQHYAVHAAASSREARSTELLSLLSDTVYADTQKKVLKLFDATKELYRLCLLKAGELKQYEHQLAAGLSLIDIKYEEANDAPRVLALAAAGDIDLALKRIESFGGADQEGVRRRFILYMLCLLELALLGSKKKPFRKSAIEKLLNHLDEQIPPDTSIIQWKEIFPSFLMFQMACEWAELGLDYGIVYKRTDDWENGWIEEKGPYSDLQFEVLLESARGITDEEDKSHALKDISTELAKQGKVDEALTCARSITDESYKIRALKGISTELAKQGKVDEALACARGITDESYKIRALKDISTELAKQGKVDEAASAMQEALTCARGITDEEDKSRALKDISTELAKQGKVDEAASAMQEALTCARGITYEYDKIDALGSISTELAKQGKVDEAASAIQEAFTCTRGISDDYWKIRALKDISTKLAKQGKVDEALTYARGITDEEDKSHALKDISTELAKQGKVDEALTCARGITDESYKIHALKDISTELAKQGKVDEALTCARGISDDNWKNNTLKDISTELAKQGKVDEALTCARGISHDFWKSRALKEISAELAKQGKVEEAASAMQVVLVCIRGINDESHKSIVHKAISTELAKQGKVDEALTCARGITYESRLEGAYKSSALKEISAELAKQGKVDEALTCARGISDDSWKSSALKDISAEMAKQGKVDEAASAMQEALTCARVITEERDRSRSLMYISAELAKQGKVDEVASAMQEALTCARGISDDYWKSSALKDISTELAKQGKVDEAASSMQEALTCARVITEERDRSRSLMAISTELAKQGKVDEAASSMQEALTCASVITEERDRSRSLMYISTKLAKQGKVDEALTCARGITYESDKSSALKDISTELAKQGKVGEAASAMQEALDSARGIRDDYWKSSALGSISTELAKQSNWALAEITGLEIPQLGKRHSCWITMAENSCEIEGFQKALQHVNHLKNDEARLFYLKGWVGLVTPQEADAHCVQKALHHLAQDSESIENLMQVHAVHEIFFGHAGREKIKQLNRTLNIQWVLDIAAPFLKEESNARFSTNLDEWLHDIPDEDDREQISLWARQVAKGRMTAQEFQKNIEKIIPTVK